MAKRTGTANLPLHGGKVPPWLFERMTRLAREILLVLRSESGPQEILSRLSDPFWFQALGCVLGFDWHSSGVTTTVCGAIKEAVRGLEEEMGIFVAGGKGKTSRKTPEEIQRWGERLGIEPGGLIYASRMAAKVDSAAVQDGYQIYHHTFVFTEKGEWAVIQQGMNPDIQYARRYHWLSWEMEEFIKEPHLAVCCDDRSASLNMVAEESEGARGTSAELSREKPQVVIKDLLRLKELELPQHHKVLVEDINPKRMESILLKTYERAPNDFEELLALRGVGPKTIRSLALISELVYGEKPSYRDPARYSFAHGGKDGHPYPVDRETYDRSIDFLRRAVNSSRIGRTEKLKALHRLQGLSDG